MPDSFGPNIIISVPKEKAEDSTGSSPLDNHRPITLSPVVSKLFKLILYDLSHMPYMNTDVDRCRD